MLDGAADIPFGARRNGAQEPVFAADAAWWWSVLLLPAYAVYIIWNFGAVPIG